MTVEIEHHGRKYLGTWHVRDGPVTVRSFYGQKSTQVGGSPPAAIAAALLHELVGAHFEFYQSDRANTRTPA